MVEHNNEDDILARAIRDVGTVVSHVAEWETVVYETEFILDMPPGAAAELVHAVLPAMKHPLLSEQPVTVDEHGISWIAGDGIGMNPVLITVSVSSETYGTALEIRGTARGERSAMLSVDAICGLLSDHFGKWDVIDVMDRYVTPSDPG